MSVASHPFLIFGILVSSASVRATSTLAGVRWAFANGAGGVGRTLQLKDARNPSSTSSKKT